MRLEKIQIRNFGLISGEFPIPPVLLITGDNRTGKSTIVKAIEVGLIGTVHDPEQDRNSTFDELAAEGVNEYGMRLFFDNGFWMDRNFVRTVDENGTVKIKSTLDFQDIPQTAMGKPRQAEAELKRILNCSTYGMHLTSIIEAKATERRKILLSMLVGSRDERPLEEWIYECSNEMGELVELDKDRLEALTGEMVKKAPTDILVLDRLYRINAAAVEKMKESKTELDNTTTLIRDLGFEDAETVDTSKLPDLEKEFKALEDENEELAKNIGSAETDKTRHDTLTTEISGFTEQEKGLGTLRDRNDIQNDIDGLTATSDEGIEETKKRFQNILDTLGKTCESDVKDLDEKIIELTSESSKIQGNIDAKGKEVEGFKVAIEYTEQRIATIKDHVETEGGESKCPVCTSVIDPEALIAIWKSDLADLKQKKQTVQEDIELALMTKKGFDDGKVVIEEKKAGLQTTRDDATTNTVTEREDAVQKIEDDNEELLKPLDDESGLWDKLDDLTTKRIEKETELNKIQLIELGPMNELLLSKKNRKIELDTDLQRMRSAESDAKKKVNLETQQFGQQQTVRCLDAIKKATGPSGIQGTLLKERIDPFIGSVNEVLHRFAPDMEFNIEFQDGRGKDSCQFGYTGNKGWCLFESASNSEKSLILFAIVIAIMNQERFVNQRIIMMDNIEKFLDLGPNLIAAAEIAVNEKLIDSAILAGALRNSDLEPIMEDHPDIFDGMIITRNPDAVSIPA